MLSILQTGLDSGNTIVSNTTGRNVLFRCSVVQVNSHLKNSITMKLDKSHDIWFWERNGSDRYIDDIMGGI